MVTVGVCVTAVGNGPITLEILVTVGLEDQQWMILPVIVEVELEWIKTRPNFQPVTFTGTGETGMV